MWKVAEHEGLAALSLHGHKGEVGTPLNGVRFLSCGKGGREWVAQYMVGGGGVSVLTSPMTFLCPQLPRQALSLLFDTYHNEVDAFLLADVSTDPGVA